ncbi:MAG: energy transducer TonB [Chitinophagaceae bacterium]
MHCKHLVHQTMIINTFVNIKPSMSRLFLTLLIISSFNLYAQKTEQGFDANFKPSDGSPRYYVVTEEKDGRWYRAAYYLPERSMALQAWYKDKECKVADSTVTWFYSNAKVKSTGNYSNGKKQGPWLEFHENGMIRDSGFYVNDHLRGVSLGWDEEGYQVDSSFFDNNGNGTQVHWYAKGPVSSAGFIVNDTSKIKRWTYYHRNGQILATEEYVNGKMNACSCFTETGQKLDSCIEREANFAGGEAGWRKFLERNLDPGVPVRRKAPAGLYTTMTLFVVNTDGSLSDIKPLTKFGYGMEEEVIRMLKASPRWEPAIQYGRKVKAYRKQPVSFRITQE